MPSEVQLDVVQLELLLFADAGEVVADAARAALDDPEFLVAVVQAVGAVLAAHPALAVLSARASW
jgi:hypothetical protein